MASNVTPFPGTVAEDIVTKLEGVLDEARAGRFVAISIAAVTADGGSFTASLPEEHVFALVGVLERAKHELLT